MNDDWFSNAIMIVMTLGYLQLIMPSIESVWWKVSLIFVFGIMIIEWIIEVFL